jgi:hypothetical protein
VRPSREPRIANAILGAWLLASAFLWPHTSIQLVNMCAIGVLAVVVALLGTRYPTLRYVNAVLALWLLVSGWAGQVATEVMAWNATLVAFAMFALSVLPISPEEPG